MYCLLFDPSSVFKLRKITEKWTPLWTFSVVLKQRKQHFCKTDQNLFSLYKHLYNVAWTPDENQEQSTC